MNALRLSLAVACSLTMSVAVAQTPPAPAGSTGECKDGTYSTAASKRGACAGHKGVKEWYAADDKAATPATAAPTASTVAPKAASAPAPAAPVAPTAPVAPKAAVAPTAAPAAGGGNGQVWVNTNSKVYHCEGDKYYGKTKAGSYMTEAAAKAAGNRPDHGKACA